MLVYHMYVYLSHFKFFIVCNEGSLRKCVFNDLQNEERKGIKLGLTQTLGLLIMSGADPYRNPYPCRRSISLTTVDKKKKKGNLLAIELETNLSDSFLLYRLSVDIPVKYGPELS